MFKGAVMEDCLIRQRTGSTDWLRESVFLVPDVTQTPALHVAQVLQIQCLNKCVVFAGDFFNRISLKKKMTTL